jgi:hypothetical protein
MARTAPFPERTAAIRQALISRKITTMRRVALLAIALATATPALANPGDAANPDERYLRVCPGTSWGIAKFSEHEAD